MDDEAIRLADRARRCAGCGRPAGVSPRRHTGGGQPPRARPRATCLGRAGPARARPRPGLRAVPGRRARAGGVRAERGDRAREDRSGSARRSAMPGWCESRLACSGNRSRSISPSRCARREESLAVLRGGRRRPRARPGVEPPLVPVHVHGRGGSAAGSGRTGARAREAGRQPSRRGLQPGSPRLVAGRRTDTGRRGHPHLRADCCTSWRTIHSERRS